MPNTDEPNAVAASDDPDAQYAELTESAPGDVEYMFAQTATGMGINLDGRITLHGVSATTLWFSDRPYRLTGHTPTGEALHRRVHPERDHHHHHVSPHAHESPRF